MAAELKNDTTPPLPQEPETAGQTQPPATQAAQTRPQKTAARSGARTVPAVKGASAKCANSAAAKAKSTAQAPEVSGAQKPCAKKACSPKKCTQKPAARTTPHEPLQEKGQDGSDPLFFVEEQNRHAAQVEFLAGVLFRELGSMHNLGPSWERRLLLGARFHDIGWKEGGKGHHKASMRILEKEDLGLDQEDRPFVALLARYHRKAWPSLRHKRFAALCGDDRAAVRTLAAILRVADGLDYTHKNVVKGLALRIRETKSGKRRAVITLTCDSDASVEIARALKKGDLFEDVFHMELRISCPHQ